MNIQKKLEKLTSLANGLFQCTLRSVLFLLAMVAAAPAQPTAVPVQPTATPAQPQATVERFSSLSDGRFETQLDRPPIESLRPGSPEMLKALETFDNLPFDVGERMHFLVTYLGIRGGSAEVVVRHPVKVGEGWGARVTGEVKSAEWYSWVAKVHDAVESVFMPQDRYKPVQFYINQQEARYFKTKIVRFNHTASQILQLERRKGREAKELSFELQNDVKDAIGALYFLRQEIDQRPAHQVFEFPIFTSEKTWRGQVRLLKSERRKVFAEEYDTDVYAMDTQFGGILQQEGDIRVWFTRDKRRLPVYIQANVQFGYIEVELAEWDQGYASPAKKKIYPKIRRPE